MPPRAKRPREDGGGARSSKVARGSEKPSSRSSKAAPTEPPALLRGNTCAENPRWLAGHVEELLDAAATVRRGAPTRMAEDAMHGFMLTLFEGGCDRAGSCGCDRAKKKDKTLWTLAGEESPVAGFDLVGLFKELVAPEYHGVLGRAQAPTREFMLIIINVIIINVIIMMIISLSSSSS
eukprot:COSAG01_NODE_5675_length_4107_cov_2.978293_6_plen_179_part_00